MLYDTENKSQNERNLNLWMADQLFIDFSNKTWGF